MKRPDFKSLKAEIKNADVQMLYNDLVNVNGMSGTALIYAVSRTISKLKPVYDALSIETCIPESDEHKKYVKQIQEVNDKYSKGKLVQQGGGYSHDFPWYKGGHDDLYLAWRKEIETLKAKNKKTVEQRERQIEEYNSFLSEPFPENIYDFIHKISKEKIEDCVVPESLKRVLTYLATD